MASWLFLAVEHSIPRLERTPPADWGLAFRNGQGTALHIRAPFVQKLCNATAPRFHLPGLQVCAWLPDLLRLNWLLETGHLPEGGYKLAASADIVISLGGRLLPLHRAVLSAGSGVLRQALEADDSTDGRAAAVQDALQGQPLPGVQLFLRLLYSGSAGAAEDMEDPWALASAAALAHSLDASGVLKASLALWAPVAQ